MGVTYIVTGAAGHLGGTIVRLLSQAGQEMRALALAGESAARAARRKLVYRRRLPPGEPAGAVFRP